MATSDSSPDLDPKVTQAIQLAVDALRAELLGHLKPQAESAPVEGAGGDIMTRLENAVEALDSAGTQTELLASLVREAEAFAERSLFLVRDGKDLKGWAAFGFSGGDDDVERVNVACPSEIADGRPTDNPAASGAICDRMAAAPGVESILVPFVLRGKVAGALYADRSVGEGGLDRPALRILNYIAAQAVETLPLRRVVDGAGVAPPLDEVDEPDEVAVEDGVTAERDVQEPEQTVEVLEEEPDSEVEVDVNRMIEEVERETYDHDDDADIVAIRQEAAPVEFDAVDEDEAEAGLDSGGFDAAVEEIEDEELEADDSAEESIEGAPVIEDASTDEGDTADLAGPVRVEPLARALDAAEVAPPADLDGPGWAFSGSESISDDSRLEEARRLARLLVTEIKLYNEEKVREGRESNNLYDQLRDDIERSRRIYEERIDDEVREEGDYFQEEVVRILAGGDSTALGA